MFRITTSMPVFFRRALYSVVLVSLITGICFFILNTWIEVEGEFGPEKHPLQYPMLKLHGAAAFIMMMYFGSLLTSHVPIGWRVRPLRKLGVVLLFAVGLQIVTAWLLYYLSNEAVRGLVAYLHLATGCTIPCLLFVHVWQHYKKKRACKKTTG